MGVEGLQGTPWHEKKIRKSCRDGSKYCVYNQQDICHCKVSEYHKKVCIGMIIAICNI